MKSPGAVFSLLIIINCFLPFICCSDASAQDIFRITVIDVGKGDCILIQTGTEDALSTVMLDTGYKETADSVLRYLKDHNIEKLDALIISHFHKDHVGGAASILKKIPTDKVYMPDYAGTRKVYEEMMKVLEDSGGRIPYERLTANTTFRTGDAEFRLYPSRIAFDGDNDNDVSMAAALEYKGRKALFAGDLEEAGIRQLLGNNSFKKNSYDILKLPHHGAQEANTSDLLALLKSGGITVITDGQDKRAHGTLIDTLNAGGFSVNCSAEDGTIIITSGADGLVVQKEKDPDYLTEGPWNYLLQENGSAVITGYTGSDTEITIPSEIGGHPVRSIADSAFYNMQKLTSITIPDSVTAVGSSAFSWCRSLKEVNIPEGTLSIGDAAFSWCVSLENVTIPDSVTSIGISGFESCTGLKRISLSNSLTAVSPSLFERCEKLEEITIPDGVKTIGKDAFKRCVNLSNVRIPESAELIDEGAFKRCSSLETIEIPDGIKTIEESAFENCTALRSISLPANLTNLGKAAFISCTALEKIVIPDGIQNIKKSTFSGCTRLTRVDLPEGVSSVKAEAFMDCKALKDIYYAGTMEQWDHIAKDDSWNRNTPSSMKIHCSDTPDDPPEPDIPSRPAGHLFFLLPKLPETGFSHTQTEAADVYPKDLRYTPTGLTLNIPSLDVSEIIVRVPFRNGEYPVEWLGSRIGMPEEFAVPGSGTCVLVGHNHLNTEEAGPFAFLNKLSEGTHLFITDAEDHMTLFSVFANVKTGASDVKAAELLADAREDTLILITCEDELSGGGYANRRVVAAEKIR